MHIRQHLLACAAAVTFGLAAPAIAGVSPQEAATLKTSLTPLGAERAGNKDGTIPAWTGQGVPVPPGYQSGDPRTDPFPGEKKLLSITAKDVAKYGDKVSQGDRALLEKYPDTYHIDVYPTHRTAIAPDWVYANTFRNATAATLTADKLGVEGAFGGTPFPIPKSGSEVIWNHELAWRGQAVFYNFATWVGLANGQHVLATQAKQWLQFPFYQKARPADYDNVATMIKQVATGPAFKVGESILGYEYIDYTKNSRQYWQYLTGQRRVRKAPTIGYDTPDFVTSGIANFDEAFVFSGSPDRYDWRLVGKQEMFIPYNNNRFLQGKIDDVLMPHHLNPDALRYELHRVWVVDATLAPGKRHVVAKRRFYVDEDSWQTVGVDEWDAQGKLWKHVYALMPVIPEMPGVTAYIAFGLYDLQTGAYIYNTAPNGLTAQYKLIDPLPTTAFSPDALAGENVR